MNELSWAVHLIAWTPLQFSSPHCHPVVNLSIVGRTKHRHILIGCAAQTCGRRIIPKRVVVIIRWHTYCGMVSHGERVELRDGRKNDQLALPHPSLLTLFKLLTIPHMSLNFDHGRLIEIEGSRPLYQTLYNLWAKAVWNTPTSVPALNGNQILRLFLTSRLQIARWKRKIWQFWDEHLLSWVFGGFWLIDAQVAMDFKSTLSQSWHVYMAILT